MKLKDGHVIRPFMTFYEAIVSYKNNKDGFYALFYLISAIELAFTHNFVQILLLFYVLYTLLLHVLQY